MDLGTSGLEILLATNSDFPNPFSYQTAELWLVAM